LYGQLWLRPPPSLALTASRHRGPRGTQNLKIEGL
jgi:hypothetical protein